jgi:hypothetical protein
MAAWAETLAIRNDLATVTALAPTKTTIYAPSSSAWAYSHHPFIERFVNAASVAHFYVMFTNAPVGEGDPGSRVVIRRSADFSTWADVKVLGPDMGRFSQKVYEAGGFLQVAGTLYAFYSEIEYDPHVMINGGRPPTDTGYLYTRMLYISTTDGVTWTAAKELGPNVVNNRAPKAIASGRYVMAGQMTMPYTDTVDALSGWQNAGICLALPNDDPSSFQAASDIQALGDSLCEVDFYQLASGEIRALFRSFASGYLWVSRSFDNGLAWSNPGQTAFQHPSSKFGTGKLSNGKFYLIGNPGTDRERMSCWTSADGSNFADRYDVATAAYTILYPGFAKSGSYGYPSLIEYSGNIYVVASQGKEAVSGWKFPLPS